MTEAKTDRHGSLSSTPRAKAVRAYFEKQGVPGRKLCVVDGCRPKGRRYSFETVNRRVTVWEKPADSDDDLTADEFGAFITACNWIVNSDPSSRFTDTDETRCAIGHRYVDRNLMSQEANPAEAGNDLADPSDGSLVSDELIDVFHHGGNRFTVIRATPSNDTDDASRRVYRVDMDKPLDTGEPVEPVLEGQPGPDESEAFDVIAAVVTQGPEYREGPQEQLAVTVENPGAGNASGTGSSGGTTGSDTSESDESWDASVIPDDADDHLEILEDWFERYGSFKSDFDPEAVEIESGAWEGTEGYTLESNPFEAGYYEGDDWNDKEGFDAHKDAFRELMQSDDAEAVQWHGEPDYVNFIPAANVSEVAE